MDEQAQFLSLSGGQTYDNHFNNPGDHSYDPLYEDDPDVNALTFYQFRIQMSEVCQETTVISHIS